MSISQLLEALKDTNVSLTISEKLLAGVSVAVLSMVVVFIVLVLISGIISLLQKMENKSLIINNIEKETETTEIEEEDNFEEVVDKFLALETDEPQLLYIWGHSYELDINDGAWENFERICKKLSGKADIFYATNKEVLL